MRAVLCAGRVNPFADAITFATQTGLQIFGVQRQRSIPSLYFNIHNLHSATKRGKSHDTNQRSAIPVSNAARTDFNAKDDGSSWGAESSGVWVAEVSPSIPATSQTIPATNQSWRS